MKMWEALIWNELKKIVRIFEECFDFFLNNSVHIFMNEYISSMSRKKDMTKTLLVLGFLEWGMFPKFPFHTKMFL